MPVILGPLTSSQAKATFPIAQENQVVAFSSTSFASGLSAIGGFIFRVSLTSDVLIPYIVRATHAKLGYREVAIIYDETDVILQSGDRVFREALTQNGVKILTRESFQTVKTDLSTQLTRIKALNPDAIFIATLPFDMPRIMIQGRDLGIPFSVPSAVAQVSKDEVEAAGVAAEGMISSSNWISTTFTPKNQDFIRNYRAKYGREPNAWAAQSYTALYILAEAIANAQSTDSKAIRDAMANIRNLDTVLGKFSFDAVGDAVYDPTILIVENGELKIFE